jgi:hypothetical protein
MKGLIADAAGSRAASRAAAQMAAMQHLGPQAVSQIGGMAKEAMKQQAQPAA